MRGTSRLLAASLALLLVVPVGLAEWPQFRHDEERSGLAGEPGAIQTPHESWAFAADGSIVSSPSVAMVDGEQAIIFGSYPGTQRAGTVYALTPEGDVRWSTTPLGSSGGYIASPTIVDLDEDGDLEIVLPSLDDSTLRVFDAATGDQVWSTSVGSTGEDLLASSPLVADVADSEGNEIVLGGSIQGHDGSLLVYDGDGQRLQAIELDGPAWSSPLYMDLDDDGDKEIAIATGVPQDLQMLFPSAKTGGGSLYVFERGPDGWQIDWRLELANPTLATPVAGDLDEDGATELLVGAQGHLYAVDAATGSLLDDRTAGIGPMASLSSPVITDIDHDGTPEVALGVKDGVRAFEMATDGSLVADGHLQLPYQGEAGDVEPWVGASLAVQDVDGDGVLDLLGMTVPVRVDEANLQDSDALPGIVFAVNASQLSYPEGVLFTHPLPDDGGLSGPTFADVDGDGRSEILAGEGVPVLGNGTTMHLLDAANPVVETITTDPPEPTDLDEIDFDAAASDEDDAPEDLSYAWTFGDGATAQGANPTHTYADDGIYNITVEVSDPDGHVWTHERELEVANVPPEIELDIQATPDSLDVGFEAIADDPDGTVTSVSWELGDGTTVNGTSLTHTYDTGGSYVASVEAVDEDGDTTREETIVHVNRFPSLTGPASADAAEGDPVTVEFDVDDPDGDPVHVESIQGAENVATEVVEGTVQLTWTPPYDIATREDSPVAVDLGITIEDEGIPAGSDEHTVSLLVENTNRAPSIEGPAEATVSGGQTTVIEGTLDDPDGDGLTAQATGLPPSATFSVQEDVWQLTVSPPGGTQPSTHDVTITADDGLVGIQHALTLAIVPNQPPEVSIDGPEAIDAHTAWAPSPAVFEGSAQDPEGDPIGSWAWRVEDYIGQGPALERKFTEHGTYELGLTARDAFSQEGNTTHTIEVDDALTGDVAIAPPSEEATTHRHVIMQATYDDGTPLADTEVDVQLFHEELDRVTAERTVETDADGLAHVHFNGEMGLPFFLPGEHLVTVETQAPSLPDAPVQDTEQLTMMDSFRVALG